MVINRAIITIRKELMIASDEIFKDVRFEGDTLRVTLTPQGKRHFAECEKREEQEQRQYERYEKAQASRRKRERREHNRWVRRAEKQLARLVFLLKSGQPPTRLRKKCAGCGTKARCFVYSDRHFCADCIKLGKRGEIEVKCPRHKEWCGGHYGTCAGCFGEDDSPY